MKRVVEILERRPWLAPALALGAMLALGIAASDDYGIAWDEPVQRQYGSEVYDYVFHHDQGLFLNRHRYYGPVFELALYSLEKALGLSDARSVYGMRHSANFVVFWGGLVFFFLLARRLFGSWKLGLVGCAMLFLSPRIFAHGFYNSKDIPFLAVFVAGVYTLLRYLDRRTIGRALAHGVVCAILVDTRIVGVMLPALTALFLGWDVARRGAIRAGIRRAAPGFAVFVASWAGVTVLLWPTLWRDPLANFVRVFEGMRNFPWEATVVYLGRATWSTALPWHYTLVWIAVSTPLAYLVLCCVGLAAGWSRAPGTPRDSAAACAEAEAVIGRRDLVLVVLWLALPLGYSIGSKAVLYDEWRHSFFVYPALLLVALAGMRWLWRSAAALRAGGARKILRAALVALVATNMAAAAAFMLRHHPFQNVYFNSVPGGPRGAHGKFEMDYWGLSYRQGLEYIAAHDPAEAITIKAANVAGRYNADALGAADRKRLVFVDDMSRARYYITNYRWDREHLPLEQEIYSIYVEGAEIMGVYELR
ncbi:MAG: glycosyltransferase family 39 protein [bacterium]